jgi:hypothetical protein
MDQPIGAVAPCPKVLGKGFWEEPFSKGFSPNTKKTNKKMIY